MIEIDGKQHYTPENFENGTIRTYKPENMDLKVIRVPNFKIYDDFENVCKFIDREIKKSLPQSAALTAPSSEGAYED